jgi:hypothetical protein
MNARLLISQMLFCIVVLPILNLQALGQSPTAQTSSTDPPKIATVPASTPSRDVTPVVNDWEPKTGSIYSVIELRGFRLDLSSDTPETFRVLFVQNGVELLTRSKGGTGITNDEFNGAQTLEVIVPEEATLGVGQIVIDRNGRRSVPATVTITEWKIPILKELIPVSGPPGTIVCVECDGFHIDDEIDIRGALGNQLRIGGGGSSSCTAFGVPQDAAEGVLTVRLKNNNQGKGQFTAPLTFTVTNDPLPLELMPGDMKSVAPGQWLDVQSSNNVVLKHSERTEVAFQQAGRTIIVALPKPFRPHVEVPGALSPGEVQLQVRTWRHGRPSPWSEPATISLAEKPVAPVVNAIRTEKGSWAHLWPGPDRPHTFRVNPGDEVVMNGLWPVADASKLRFSLMRAGDVIDLNAAELNEKAEWFSDVRVRLPESLSIGEWRLIVSSETDGSLDEVPLVIKAIPKASVPK